MLAIAWRVVAMILLMPFSLMFPLIFIAWPLQLYLAISLAARIWRRSARVDPAL